MENETNFVIQLSALPEGTYSYDFLLDDSFFKRIEATEVQRGNVSMTVDLRKSQHATEIHFTANGKAYVPCDRCMEDVEVEVDAEEDLTVRFGEAYEEVDDSLIVIPEAPGEIDLSWYMYEVIALSIPIRHVHPDGECVGELAGKLKSYLIGEKEETADSDVIDSRWEGLKALKEKGFPEGNEK